MPRHSFQTAHLAARGVYVSAFVSALAVSTLSGCSTRRGEHTLQDKAARATVSIDPNSTKGDHTSGWYRAEADKVALPELWVSEAQQATAQIEAERAAGQSAMVTAEANRSQAFAEVGAARVAAQSELAIGNAGASKMRTVYNAKLAELETQAVAGQKFYEADDRRNDAILTANVKEWQAEVERMRSGAESDWSRSLAEHEQMLSARKAVDERGRATIEQMLRQADLTETRSAAKTAELRSQSRAVAEQTQATVSEINFSIKTEQEKTAAEVADLRQQSKSVGEHSAAEVADLTAQADALEKMDVDQVYNTKLIGAKAEFDKQHADAEQTRLQAESMKQAAAAEIDRRRAEAKKTLEDARREYSDALTHSETLVVKGKADVAVGRAQADKLEREARARFVRAEIEARVDAVREQAKQQSRIADAEFERIRGDAEAQAAKLQAQVSKELAQQTKNGSVSLPGNTEPTRPGATSGDPVPVVTDAPARPATLRPDRVAAFKTALGEVAKLRSQADAAERSIEADGEARVGGVTSWWKEQVAAHDAGMTELDALERKTSAQFAEMTSQTESRVASATAGRTKAEVDAEAFKRETGAKISSLRARADAVAKKSVAKTTLLTAQADASERNGKSRVEALAVKRDATMRRGTAMAQQLLTEADSLELGQKAVVAQLREEIRAAESILTSELARLDRAAQTYVEVARANYDESLVNAGTFEKIAVANAGELQANNLAARKQAQASVEFVRNLATSGQLLADASVTRAAAEAEAEMSRFGAQEMLAQAAIEAEHRIAGAAADERFVAADARELATRARFDSRVAMTESDRNRAYSELYLTNQQDRARQEQAIARANAYKELSNAAIARLEAAGASFSKTASHNWDSRLAIPAPLPAVENPAALANQAEQTLQITPAQTTVTTPAPTTVTGVDTDGND